MVLKYELAHGETEEQYERDLELLNSHLALAAGSCSRFDRLISERSGLGADLREANRMLLDKLAEIRAIVGLQRLGFRDVAYEGTPDLSAALGTTIFAVEVTRLAASAGQKVRFLTLLWQGDRSEHGLADELFGKIQAKYEQLSKLAGTYAKHLIWISLGRDYFTAGLYERGSTGLRSKMPGYVSDQLNLAVARVRREMLYPELAYVVVCPGREEAEIVADVASAPSPPQPQSSDSAREE